MGFAVIGAVFMVDTTSPVGENLSFSMVDHLP